MTIHCPTCTCQKQAEREQRRAQERREREQREREQEFARRHSVLPDELLDWARGFVKSGVAR